VSERQSITPPQPPAPDSDPGAEARMGLEMDSKPRILIVDDEVLVRNMLRQNLTGRGYDVDVAINGREALTKVAGTRFDAVVCDILMPETDGLEVVIHVRKHHPNLPVIAISAPGSEMFLESARALGAARTFEKPFEVAHLCSAIDDLLNRASSSRVL
jgi:CheY-like chemotaxis protein